MNGNKGNYNQARAVLQGRNKEKKRKLGELSFSVVERFLMVEMRTEIRVK